MTERSETAISVGRIDLGPTEPRHLTQSEQRMMDAALRRSVRPAPADDMWRVDVAGIPISVRGEAAKDHLEAVVRQMARMKLALNKLKWEDGKVGETAKAGLS
jgi:hypothetical protein